MDFDIPEVEELPKILLLKSNKTPEKNYKNYNSLSIVNELNKPSEIIDRWEFDRENIYKNLLEENLNFLWGSVASDIQKIKSLKNCRCIPCKILSKFFVKDIEYDTIINIRSGKYKNKKFVAQRFFNTLSSYVKSVEQFQLLNMIFKNYSMINICESDFENSIDHVQFYKSKGIDTEHYAFISCIIEKEMKKENFPLFPRFKWIYRCDRNFVIVNEISKLKLEEIYFNCHNNNNKIEVTKEILIQIVSTLHFLNKFSFTHGNPKISYINIENSETSFVYDNFVVNSSYLISISPSNFSSISFETEDFKKIRIYHPGNIYENRIDFNKIPNVSFKPFVSSVSNRFCKCKKNGLCISDYLEKRIISYKIENDILPYIKYLGIPLFHSSYDLYSFLIEFMYIKDFKISVVNDEVLSNIWKQLWLKDEYEEIMLKFENEYDPNFLKNFHLRCDALNITWESIKNCL